MMCEIHCCIFAWQYFGSSWIKDWYKCQIQRQHELQVNIIDVECREATQYGIIQLVSTEERHTGLVIQVAVTCKLRWPLIGR